MCDTEIKRPGSALLGLDVGSVNIHAALQMPDGSSASWVRPVRGRLREAVCDLLGECVAPRLRGMPVRAGLTGAGIADSAPPCPVVRTNEVVAVVEHVRREVPGAGTLIDFGGQYTKWISLDRSGKIADFASNGLCAAGSGAFLAQQAGRLDVDVEQLGGLAFEAERGATVAGRCAVFAKSDMIHHQQKGTPVEAIAYGLCQALVRTFESSVLQGRRLDPKVVLVGGGAANQGLVRAFNEQFALNPGDVEVLDPFTAGAKGAARCAEAAEPIALEELEKSLIDSLQSTHGVSTAHDPPLQRKQGEFPSVESRRFADEGGPVSGFLGIDVGSVSTNLVVLDESHRLLEEIYLRTRGRPVEALFEGLEKIRQGFKGRLEILGVGVTGSGRHLASGLVGADAVRNEITAQLTSSAHYLPDVDTVFEIGGQDSKYIGIRRGHLAGFEMNKICAAGTGSFLEEQAEGLGISIFDEFAELAFRGRAPCDLGSQCTVFMDAELRRAQQRGADLPDLCAGLSYSVARNYLERVVGGREVGDKVVFQGGTASNAAVVAALRGITGRDIVVHPHNRVSGAIGAALLAMSERDASGYETRFFGFEACVDASVRVFECKSCENRCQVSKVEVGGRRMHFGDICEKFTEGDAGGATGFKGRDLFAERSLLYEGYVDQAVKRARARKANKKVLLPRVSVMHELAPLFATWVGELGYEPQLGAPADSDLTTRGARELPAEMCLPVKIAAGQIRRGLEEAPGRMILAPSVVEMPGSVAGTRSTTCYFTQEWTQMLEGRGEKVVTPQIGLEDNAAQRFHAARELSRVLETPVAQTAAALVKAVSAQRRFSKELQELGTEVLNGDFEKAVVVFGRPYNVHDTFANLNLPRHLRRLGLLAIPYDALPVDEVKLDERWKTVPWYYNRRTLQALEVMRSDRRLFPIVVSSFGCGVDGFFFKHLAELLGDRPNMLLEFDEHRAEAGLVTRLEAFADEIDEHIRRGCPARSRRTTLPGVWPRGAKRVFIPAFGEFSRAYSGAFRLAGFETVVWPEPDEGTLRKGESVSSGRECHPFSIMAGQYLEMIDREDSGPRDVICNLICDVVCLLKQYGDGIRIAQQRLGKTGPAVVDFNTGRLMKLVGVGRMLKFFEALGAIEILFTLSRRVRPYAEDPRAPIERYRIAAREIEETLVAEESILKVLGRASSEIWDMATRGRPGDRPVIGVTGDMYTRVVDFSNGGLFDRLEQLGNEVWPSPMIASWSPLADGIDAVQAVDRLDAKKFLSKGASGLVTARLYDRLVSVLPEPARELVREPNFRALLPLARPYVGPRTSWIISTCIGKCADFLRRGCGGVISAAGVGCMVGTSVAGAVPALRRDHGGAPVLALTYGGKEGPVHRIRVETFSHQVAQRHRRNGTCRLVANRRVIV